MSSTLLHALGFLANRPGHQRFVAALRNVESTQRTSLSRILASTAHTEYGRQIGIDESWSAEKFSQRVPIINYDSICDLIKLEMAGNRRQVAIDVLRYQPTSGSTLARKWIPYTNSFLKELQGAIAPWLFDAYSQHRGLRQGKHYWSLSWLPDDLRGLVESTDDTTLLPLVKRVIQRQVMAVPQEVQRAKTSDAAMFATICWLAATPDLTLISVWSPTFALGLLHRLMELRNDVAKVLAKKDWGSRAAALGKVPCPSNPGRSVMLETWDGSAPEVFFHQLWPQLCVLSTWTTGASKSYMPNLRNFLPHVTIESKGLWATEGVVTIPFRGSFPLAICSHFLEFRCRSTGRIMPAWHLERDQLVQPIITASSGLLRYELSDELLVTGRMEDCPTLEFRARIGGIDLVGEKIDAVIAAQAIEVLQTSHENHDYCRPLTMVAVQATPRPYYVALAEGQAHSPPEHLAEILEAKMQEFHHYRLARDLDQLSPARVVICRDAARFLAALGRQRGMIDGDVKAEILVHCGSEELFEIALKESCR